MNLEDLNKSQLILLTVLVNFVVSIATGILTVSLLDEAPPVVTQTVNRIVEHTVETVAEAAPATVIQAPKPSVEDLITNAFGADEARVVYLYDIKAGTSTDPIALATYLPKSRAAVTVTSNNLSKEMLVLFPTGELIDASLSKSDASLMIFGFSDTAKLPAAPVANFVPAKSLRVGQTALALSKDGDALTGIVSKVSGEGISTTLGDTPAGASAVDLQGNLIGISAGGTHSFISADHVLALLVATSSSATTTDAH